jgi:hypothetical protein
MRKRVRAPRVVSKRLVLRAQLFVSATDEFLLHYNFLLFYNGTYRDNEKGNRTISTVYSANPTEVLTWLLVHLNIRMVSVDMKRDQQCAQEAPQCLKEIILNFCECLLSHS